jgi:RHS repeat-associated protein
VPTASQGSSTQPFGYTGQQADANGLVYLRARYYDPASGRIMSRDPLAGNVTVPLSLNRYTYTMNNPVSDIDPSGLMDAADVSGGGGAGAPAKSRALSDGSTDNPCFSSASGSFIGNLVNAACTSFLGLAQVAAVVQTPAGPALGVGVMAAAPSPPGGGGSGAPGRFRSSGVTKPAVSNPKLANIISYLYTGLGSPRQLGTGSTADAIRYEMATGLPTEGKFHTQKGTEGVSALQNWLRRNPGASAADRQAAQDVLDDLRNALAGR